MNASTSLFIDDPFAPDAGRSGSDRRPYYNNLFALIGELSYALDKNLTALEYVYRHIHNWNFSSRLDILMDNRFEHEFAHLLLGLRFMKMGDNPIPFDRGYDGNKIAESVVITLEDLCFRSEFFYNAHILYSKSKSPREAMENRQRQDHIRQGFINSVTDQVTDEYVIMNIHDTAIAQDMGGGRKSGFVVRRDYHFERLDGYIDAYPVTPPKPVCKEHQAILDKQAIPDRQTLGHIYDIMLPAIVAVMRHSTTIQIQEKRRGQSDFLKIMQRSMKDLCVRDLWDCINNGDAEYSFTPRASRTKREVLPTAYQQRL